MNESIFLKLGIFTQDKVENLVRAAIAVTLATS